MLITVGAVARPPRCSPTCTVDHQNATGLWPQSWCVSEPAAGISRLEGGWQAGPGSPSSECFGRGDLQVLIGTQALLGEGWGCPAVTGVIDLSTTTAPSARDADSRARTAQGHSLAGKVALNWTVVCVSSERPRGDQDWGRLVRKHEGFFGTDADGEVVDGVAHIDPAFSAFEPPQAMTASPRSTPG